MRIVSYNIRKAVGLDWRRDGDRIVDVLAELDGDVVVLQEADRRVGQRQGVLPLARLERELGYELAPVAMRPLSHGWHGNAIFYRADLRLRSHERIDIPTIEPRGVVAARFSNPAIEVIGVHLGLTPGIRKRQMMALADRMARCDQPMVLAGDFNEWKADRGYFDPVGTMVSPGASFHASRPRVALDRFVFSHGISAQPAHVHRSELARVASDHLPIYVDLDL